VKRSIPWIGHLVNDVKIAGDLNIEDLNVGVHTKEKSLCLICRGGRLLCGRDRCPALLKLYSFLNIKKKVNTNNIIGSSPPSIFVGRIGYPYVYAGPLVPPVIGDTSIFDDPERWLGRDFDEIIGFRTNLIRGKFRVNVKKPYENRLYNKTLEIALSKDPIYTDVHFRKKPYENFLFDEIIQPMGPAGILKKMSIGTTKTDLRIDKIYGDTDLKAKKSILNLYLKDVSVSKIQRVFSFGVLGQKKQRRLVPTRWSITAVDSTISRWLIEERIKGKKQINDYQVHEFSFLGNRFIILLIPSAWRYEWIEAWYPNTTFNPNNKSIAMGSDHERYEGRKKYASIGGCYYSVRLASAEYLARENRQAGVIAMREIYPSFITPLGVWINRECVREALRKDSRKFNTLKEALTYIDSRFTIDIKEWISTSNLIQDDLHQLKITEYLKMKNEN
jgi:hypothetical protein